MLPLLPPCAPTSSREISLELLSRQGDADVTTFEERELTLRERVAGYLERTGTLWRIDVIQTVFSLIACVHYVVATYDAEQTDRDWMWLVEVILSGFFALDYLLALFLAPSMLRYVISPFAVVDLLTILPVFIPIVFQGRPGGAVNLGILRVIRVFRVLRTRKLGGSG